MTVIHKLAVVAFVCLFAVVLKVMLFFNQLVYSYPRGIVMKGLELVDSITLSLSVKEVDSG